jgi:hypothetical protein
MRIDFELLNSMACLNALADLNVCESRWKRDVLALLDAICVEHE